MTNLRFVITGGPGAGKTTILNALAERGYRYAAESARAIIRQRLASGLSPRPPLAQFGNEILRRDIARYWETRVTDHPVFFDRGIVDALCVLDQQHAIALGEAEAYVRLFPYNNVVLLMPPWEAIYRTDAERDQTFAEWCTTWYMREETLEAAFTHLVNYHHKLPLSQVWGSGILSSSDGQRFPVSGKNRHARVFPPPLGYGQGLTFYSWTSDQLSQYGFKPVSITARDATYVLDAILGNETELAVVEHTTDTAGATEMIFALFDLLGLRFTPRLRDIGSRRLYRSGAIDLHHYPRLQPHITGRINWQRVLDWWDTMLRAAGSMKLGHVTASLLVQKLQAYPQQNALAQALQEYGRLVRTLHVLRWYANNEDRRRIMRQLNKGEALHDLRAYLMIANKGQLRRKRGDELVNQASCLNLVTNAVILWNTVCMAEAVAQLKREGYPVRESDLPHIWPTRYEHINVYGRFHFNIEEAQRRKGLRPLRQSGGNLP